MLTNDAYIFDKNTLKILQNIITVINKGKAKFSAATALACKYAQICTFLIIINIETIRAA